MGGRYDASKENERDRVSVENELALNHTATYSINSSPCIIVLCTSLRYSKYIPTIVVNMTHVAY